MLMALNACALTSTSQSYQAYQEQIIQVSSAGIIHVRRVEFVVLKRTEAISLRRNSVRGELSTESSPLKIFSSPTLFGQDEVTLSSFQRDELYSFYMRDPSTATNENDLLFYSV